MSEQRKTIVGLILLAVMTFAVYSFGVNDAFKTMDDDYSIVRNEKIRSFRNLPDVVTSSFFGGDSYYRPLVTVSFMKEYFLFKLNPVPYYIDNILIHVINTFLIFGIVFHLTDRRKIAMGVAFLFALHPVHWEAVSNISGRAILLSACYYFASFYCFLLVDRKKYFSYLSLAFFAFALLCKESAGVLPLLLFSYIFFMKRKESFNFPRLVTIFMPYAMIVGAYIMVRYTLGITKTFPWRSVNEMALGFTTFLRSVMTDLRLLIFPLDLYFDRSQQIFISLLNPEAILTILFWGIVVVVLWKKRKEITGLQAFFISWFFIELFPVSQIVSTVGVQPGYISSAEHFLYTPSVGFFVLAVIAYEHFKTLNLQRKSISPNVVRFGTMGMFVFLILMTIQYNIYSSNEIAMFERTLKINPANTRIRSSLALSYAKRNRFEDAERNFKKVLDVEPFNVRARIGYGKALCDQGKFWDGLREYEKITDSGEHQTLLDENIRSTLLFMESKYDRIVRAQPDNARAYYSLGVIFSKLGKPNDAINNYEKAISLDGNLKEAIFNLASTYAMTGERDKAITLYERVLALKSGPDDLDRLAAKHLGSMARRGITP